MSDLERINLKKLPPVPALADWPERYSQTLLAKADRCMRAAYLYVKYHGGAPGHQLDRGSLSHAVFQRMTEDLIVADAQSYLEPEFTQNQHGVLIEEDPEMAARQIASMTAEIVDEVAREHPELVVPFREMEAVRMMAYHFAIGWKIDPNTVAGVERKFVMDIAGHEVSGIIDFCSIDGTTAGVDDFKTSWNRIEQNDYEDSFQARLYALLLVFGQPVERQTCTNCDGAGGGEQGEDPENQYWAPCRECGERGYVEVRLPAIGQHVQRVNTREIYPRFLEELPDGTLRMQQRDHTLSRTNLMDFRRDLERLIAQVDEARESGLFPAVDGGHCQVCPARPECPLPKHLRDFGQIVDAETAATAASWSDQVKAEVARVDADLKAWAGENGGRVRYGRDLVREFTTSTTRSVRKTRGRSDWDGLRVAVERAAELGEPFDFDAWVKTSSTNTFKKRALSAEELAAEKAEGKTRDELLEERFGEVPF